MMLGCEGYFYKICDINVKKHMFKLQRLTSAIAGDMIPKATKPNKGGKTRGYICYGVPLASKTLCLITYAMYSDLIKLISF